MMRRRSRSIKQCTVNQYFSCTRGFKSAFGRLRRAHAEMHFCTTIIKKQNSRFEINFTVVKKNQRVQALHCGVCWTRPSRPLNCSEVYVFLFGGLVRPNQNSVIAPFPKPFVSRPFTYSLATFILFVFLQFLSE